MRRLLLALPLLVAACATYDLAADSREWIFNEDGEVRLVYGTPQSDDAPLMLHCAPGSGRIQLSQNGLRPGDGISLASGAQATVVHGESEPDQLNGGVSVTAEVETRTPVLAAFRATGQLVVAEAGRSPRFHATPQERGLIEQFFARCG